MTALPQSPRCPTVFSACIYRETGYILINLINLIILGDFMKTVSASDAKREFGDLLLKAQQAPIEINKNGKPVAVVVSSDEYQQLQTLKEIQLKAELQKGLDDIAAGRVQDGETVIANLRKRVR